MPFLTFNSLLLYIISDQITIFKLLIIIIFNRFAIIKPKYLIFKVFIYDQFFWEIKSIEKILITALNFFHQCINALIFHKQLVEIQQQLRFPLTELLHY